MFITILFVFAFITLNAQSGFWHYYGIGLYNVPQSLIQTEDGGYFIASGTDSDSLLLIKTNAEGNILWTHTYGSEYTWRWAIKIIRSSDGNYVILGENHNTMYAPEIYFLKIDSEGIPLIEKTITWQQNSPYDIKETDDDGFIICTWYGLTRTNALGDTLWTRRYPDFYGNGVPSTVDGGSIEITPEHNYLVASWLYSPGILYCTNAMGDSLWVQNYSFGSFVRLYDMKPVGSNGYIIVGGCQNDVTGNDILILRVDPLGNILWSKIVAFDGEDRAYCVTSTGDGWMIGGRLGHLSWPCGSKPALLRTDTDGDTLWTKSYGSEQSGGTVNDIIQSADGNFVFTGWGVDWYVGPPNTGIFLAKCNPNGIVTVDDHSNYTYRQQYQLYQNYPNPFKTNASIKYSLPKSSDVKIQIYNVRGQLVETLIDEEKPADYYTVEWKAKDMSSGIYFYKLSTRGGSAFGGETDNGSITKKMLLVR
jgi:hypothetical protein